jgi:hypothetical protein
MHRSHDEWLAVQQASELERPLGDVEHRLSALAAALRDRDAGLIETEAAALHRALAAAVDGFGRAARQGPIPPPLRHRLMAATGQVAAQREVLARATASLDRAIDILLPAPTPGIYAADGAPERVSRGADLHG